MDPVYDRYAYVTYEDLEYLNKNRLIKIDASDDEEPVHRSNYDEEEDITENRDVILAIRAPYGSTLEIPNEA